MTQLILVRHGQTAWNKRPRFRGRADIELDDTGLAQAKATAARIAQWPVSAVYSSPLKRAIATAHAIAKEFDLSVQVHDGLLDIYFGTWQGLTPQQARADNGELLETWLKSPQEVTFPQGESLAQVRDRVSGALDELTAKQEGKTIVLVSHVVVLKVLLCYVLGLDNSHFWKIEQGTCAINIVKANGSDYVVSLINDTCHLDK